MLENDLRGLAFDIDFCHDVILGDTSVFRSEKNKAFISGILDENFWLSHKTMGERFYQTTVRVERMSGTMDYIHVIVREKLIENYLGCSLVGRYVEVSGEFRSVNNHSGDGRARLLLNLYATDVKVVEDDKESQKDSNYIYLNGTVCKQPNFRITPNGREVTDIMLAVNRINGRFDYIPCIAWGVDAYYARDLEVGTKIELSGRIQSRNYFKRCASDFSDGLWKTAYEVSIRQLRRAD